jgi:hypothetical protein
MSWKDQLKGDPIPWLLEPSDPDVRHLALRDLLHLPAHSPELLDAKKQALMAGPIARILNKMEPEGYWVNPGAGYSPKFRSNVWMLLLLAQLGARMDMDERIARAVQYYLDNAVHPDGQISHDHLPSGTFDCLQGNMCFALLSLDCRDAKLDAAVDWMARTVTGDDMAPQNDKNARYHWHNHQCGPLFACSANGQKSCAWGAVKIMQAFGVLPSKKRTARIEAAIQAGVDFLFSVDLMKASWPTRSGTQPNPFWWKFGFPVFYYTDLLQAAEALVWLGYSKDKRLADTLEFIRDKQDDQGRWRQEQDYDSRTWLRFGRKNEPNKWVTLRALKVLQMIGS